MGAGFSWSKKITVTDAAPVDVVFPMSAPVERLTVWANSGARDLTSVDFQPRVNGSDYGSAVSVAAAPAADVVYRSGGAAAEDDIIPYVSPSDEAAGVDPFVFSIRVTNNTPASSVDVTLHFAGIWHQG